MESKTDSTLGIWDLGEREERVWVWVLGVWRLEADSGVGGKENVLDGAGLGDWRTTFEMLMRAANFRSHDARVCCST